MKIVGFVLLFITVASASPSIIWPDMRFRICPGNLRYLVYGSACSCDDQPETLAFCRIIFGFPQCRCPPGTIKMGVDKCVPPTLCPKKICPGDLVYRQCGSRCTPTCRTPNIMCPKDCGVPRCECPPGTVLNGKNRCIHPAQCPVQTTTLAAPIRCSGDLVFSECGSMCTFTCKTKLMACALGCAKPRCQCPGGTVLVGKDKCISPDQCPDTATTSPSTKCSGDLEFRECSSMCTFTCESKSMICSKACAEPRCQCPSGKVLVGNDKCIRPEECPRANITTTPSVPEQPIVCSGDLVFRACGSMCTFTCNTKVMLCPLGCAAPRCQCLGGRVLLGEDQCIKPQDCPNRNSTTPSVPLSTAP